MRHTHTTWSHVGLTLVAHPVKKLQLYVVLRPRNNWPWPVLCDFQNPDQSCLTGAMPVLSDWCTPVMGVPPRTTQSGKLLGNQWKRGTLSHCQGHDIPRRQGDNCHYCLWYFWLIVSACKVQKNNYSNYIAFHTFFLKLQFHFELVIACRRGPAFICI